MSKPSFESVYTLKPILEKLEGLPMGGSFIIREIPSQIDKIRSWLYQHLQREGMTKHFKITREASDALQVFRRVIRVAILEDPPVEELGVNKRAIERVLETILDLTEPEAMAEIRKAVEANRLTDSEALSVMEEYTRVMQT